MKLKKIIAEALYLEAMHHKPSIPLSEQDPVIRDFYYQCASNEIPQLLSSYFGANKNQMFYRFIDGCITNFINQHGNILNEKTKPSLIKRIIRNLPEYTRQLSIKENCAMKYKNKNINKISKVCNLQ